MNKLAPSNKQKGFTLIELLIVIALLGALVVGLIAALDPIEQIRRGRDAALRDQAAQAKNAEDRYYAARGTFTTTLQTAGTYTLSALNTNGDITELTNAGELKATYSTAVTTNGAVISFTSVGGTTPSVTVCYDPQSKQFSTDPNNNCTSAGVCSGAPSATTYTCLK